MTDPYVTLGVERTADVETIKRAYRKLAAKYHPDRGGDTSKFQELQSAYDILSDPQKRAAHDRPAHQFHGGIDLGSIFDIFGPNFRGHPGVRPQIRMALWIQLSDVITGGKRLVAVGTQTGVSTVEIEIPDGIDDGGTVQYGGIAPGGGDLIVTFRIHPHPGWSREGLNLHTEVTITFWDCILGSEVEVRELTGKSVKVTVPPKCQPGTILRLKNKGIALRNTNDKGDLLIKIQARIPEDIPSDLIELITNIRGE